MKTRKPRADAVPSRGTSDNLCKLLAERHPEKFVEWLFGPPSGPVKVLKTELSREPLRADAAILLENTEEIFHIEFQTTGQSHIPLPVRMLNYYALFKYRYPERRIQQALVLLKDDGADIPRQSDRTAHRFSLRTHQIVATRPRAFAATAEFTAFGGFMPC